MKASTQRHQRAEKAEPVRQQEAPKSLAQLLLKIEQVSRDPERLTSLMQAALQQGLVDQADVLRIERFVQGERLGRPLPDKAQSLGLPDGLDLTRVQLDSQLPGFMARGGMDAAAMGSQVSTIPGAIDVEAGVGTELLGHELGHVADHQQAGTETAIHFDKGPTKPTAKPKVTKKEIEAVKLAHAAELKAIVRHLKGHTSDEDVHKVCNILSHWDSTTITAAWYAVPYEWLEDILDNLELEHFKKHPRELAATFQRLTPESRYKRIIKLCDAGWFDSVSSLEATTALYLLQNLPKHLLDAFQKHDGGKHYRRFKTKLPGDQVSALEKGVDPKQEKKLRAEELKRRGVADAEAIALGKKKDPKADPKKAAEDAKRAKATKSALARIEKLLWTGISDWAVRDWEAKKVLDIFKGLSDEASIGAIVHKLEAKDLVNKWLDNLPESYAYKKENVGTLIKALKHRPPELAIQHAVKLLSYGLFDWKVYDEEAILAYHLIRALPASAQHKFKMRDTAKWFARMEEQLEKKVKTGQKGYTGKDGKEGYGLLDKGSKHAAKERAEDQKVIDADRTALDKLVKQAKDADDKSAPKLLHQLAGDASKLRAYVRYLDRFQAIMPLLDALGTKKWIPANAKATLAVLKVRDPAHNIATVRELLSTSFWSDWEVTKEEARWAYEIIKSMPANIREEFIKKDPEWFDKMNSEISLELRKSKEFGFYEGGGGDKQALLGQLADPKIWEKDQAGRLLMVLRMIAQAGMMRQALPHVQAHWTKENDAKLKELGLTKKGKLKAENVVDKTDHNTLSMIIDLLGAAVNTEHFVSIIGWGLGVTDVAEVRGLRIADVQKAMGGHVAGVEFGKSKHKEDSKDKQDSGEIDGKFDEAKGLIAIKAASLPITSVNVLIGTTAIRAAGGTVDGIDFQAKYATDQDARTFLKIGLGKLKLSNLMIVLKDRMFGIGSIELDALEILGRRPTGDAPQIKTRQGFWAKLGELFTRIVKALAWLIEATPILGDIAPLNPLFDPGKEAGVGERFTDAFSKNFNLKLKLGGLTVKDIVDSRGGHIKEVKLGETKLDLTMSHSAECRNRIQEIEEAATREKRKLTSAEKQTIAELKTELAGWLAKEKQYEELRKQKEAGKKLSKGDQATLAKLEKELAPKMTGSIKGTLSVKGLNMAGLKADELTLKGVKLSGDGKGLKGKLDAYTTKQGQLGRLSSLTKPGANGLPVPALTVKADEITGKNVSYTSSERRDQALDKVIAALAKKVKDKTITEDELSKLEQAKRERQSIQPQVEEFQALYKRFASLTPKEAKRYAELQAFLQQAPSFTVKSLNLKGGSITYDPASKGVSIAAKEGTLTDASFGDAKVKKAELKDLKIAASGKKGSVSVDAKSIRLEVVRLESKVAGLNNRLAELNALAKKRDLSSTERGEKQRLEGLLGQYQDLKQRIEEVGKKVSEDPKDLSSKNELARLKSELKRWETTAKADLVQADDVHIKATGLGDMLKSGWKLPNSGVTIGSTDGKQPMVGKLSIKGAELDGQKLGDVKATDIGGKVHLEDKDTVRLDNLSVGSLSVKNLHYASSGLSIDVNDAVRLDKLAVNAVLTWGLVEKDGARHRKLTDVFVDSLDVQSLKGTKLNVKVPGKFEAQLKSGTLNGIRLEKFRLSDKTLKHAHIDSTQIVGLQKLVVGGVKASADKITAGRISLDGVDSGKIKASLADLEGDNIKVDKPGLGITIKKLKGGGVKDLTYDPSTGAIDFGTISIGSLNFSRVNWTSGDKSINVRKALVAHGVTVKGFMKPPPKSNGKDADKKTGLVISLLRINKAVLSSVDYEDKAAGRRINVISGSIEPIVLEDFELDSGKLELSLENTDLKLGPSQLTSALSAQGHLAVKKIGLQILGTAHTRTKIEGVSTKDLQLKFKSDKAVVVTNLGGSKDIGGTIETKGDTTKLIKWSLGTVSLGALDVTAGSRKITSKSKVKLLGTTFDATIKQGKGGKSTVSVPKLHIDRIEAGHLRFEDGDLVVEVNKALKKEDQLSIVNVDLKQFHMSDAGITGQLDSGKVDSGAISLAMGKKVASARLKAESLMLRFEKDGKLVTRLKGMDLEAFYGKKGKGQRGKLHIKKGDTGEITIGKEEIRIPALNLGSIKLSQFVFGGDAIGLLGLTGHATLTGTTADLTIHLNSEEDRKKGASAIKKVHIQSLVVPKTTISDVQVWLRKQGLVLRIPGDREATLTKLELTDFFVTAPKKSGDAWGMKGKFGIKDIDLPKLGVDMGKSFKGTTDLKAKTLSIDFLESGGKKIKLAELTASNVDGKVSGSGLIVKKGTVKGLEINQDKDGRTSISSKSITVSGITYDAGVAKVDINEATLPKGFKMPADPSKPVKVPHLEITRADFDVPDVMKLASQGGGKGSSGGGGIKNLKFLDTIDGSITGNVRFSARIDYYGIRNANHKINAQISNGKLDFAKLENGLSAMEDSIIDFEVKDDPKRLILQLDFVVYKKELIRWSFPNHSQYKLADDDSKVHLSTFAKPEMKSSGGSSPIEIFYVNFKNLNADLDMEGPSTIDMGKNGKIRLGGKGKDGVKNLKVTGGLNIGQYAKRSAGLDLNIAAINASLENFRIGGAKVDTKGGIFIKDVSNVHLDFVHRELAPKHLKGTIGKAIAKDIEVRLPPKKKKK